MKEVGCDFSLCGYLRCVIWVKMRVTFNIYSKKNNIGKVHMEGKKQGVHSYGINYLMFLLNLVICCRHFDHGIMILCWKWCSKLRNIFISLNGELKEEKEEALIASVSIKVGEGQILLFSYLIISKTRKVKIKLFCLLEESYKMNAIRQVKIMELSPNSCQLHGKASNNGKCWSGMGENVRSVIERLGSLAWECITWKNDLLKWVILSAFLRDVCRWSIPYL